MAKASPFDCDEEFLKLVAHRNDADLTVVALEIARDFRPDVDFAATLDWIGARSEEVGRFVARARTERESLELLARHLAEECGLSGDDRCYDDPEASFLDRVVQTGRGLPLTLSLVYMAVARGAGLELQGVSSPRHFVTRYDSVDGPLFLDAFSGGRLLAAPECLAWFAQLTHLPAERIRPALKAVGPRTIVIRMLDNLKSYFARHDRWPQAWLVQHRLAALQPGSYRERRDLAVISLRANRPGSAIDLLESCLRNCPQDEADGLRTQLAAARSEVSRWN
jgi:regulator of sirC expression with transglutaminase-like and TPR domain